MFFNDPISKTLTIVTIVVGLALFAWMLYTWNDVETVSLRKDQWTCTDAHSEPRMVTTMIGEVPVPQTVDHFVCDKWVRKPAD